MENTYLPKNNKIFLIIKFQFLISMQVAYIIIFQNNAIEKEFGE